MFVRDRIVDVHQVYIEIERENNIFIYCGSL